MFFQNEDNLSRAFWQNLFFIAGIIIILSSGIFAALELYDNIFDALISVFFPSWVLILAGFSFTLISGAAASQMTIDRVAGCKKLAEAIRSNAITSGYRFSLKHALDFLDRKWSLEADPLHQDKTELSRAWSFGLLNFCLGLAIAYPLVAMLAQWALTGESIRLSSFILLPEGGSIYYRTFTVIALIVLSGVLLWNFSTQAPSEAQPLDDKGKKKADNLKIRQLIIALITIATLLLFFSDESLVLAGLAAALAFSVLTSGIVAISITLVIAVGANFSLAIVIIIALLGQYYLGTLLKRKTLMLLIYLLLLFVILGFTANFLIERDSHEAKIFMIVGFLPILNALFDFISIGFTRHRLRLALKYNSYWFNSVIDFVFGIAFFVILLGIVFAIYALLLDKNGLPLFSAKKILTDIRNNPDDYFWFFLIFSSTLIPTFLHFSLATLTSIATLYPKSLKHLANLVDYVGEDGRSGLAVLISPVFGLWGYIAVALPLILLNCLYLVIVAFGVEIVLVLFDILDVIVSI